LKQSALVLLMLVAALGLCRCAGPPAGVARAPAATATAIAWVGGPVHPEAGPVLSALYAPGAQNSVAWLPDGTFWNGDFEIALFDGSDSLLRFGPREYVSGGFPIARASAASRGDRFEVSAFMPWRGADVDSLGWALITVTLQPRTGPPDRTAATPSLRLAARSGGARWHFLDGRCSADDTFRYVVKGRSLSRNGRQIAYISGANIAPGAHRLKNTQPGIPSTSYGGWMASAPARNPESVLEWRIWIAPVGGVTGRDRPPGESSSTLDLLARTVRAWRSEMAFGATYEVPDANAQRVLLAARSLLVGTRARGGGRLRFPGSPFQYRDYFLRDGARVVRALDLLGRPELARTAVENLFEFQWPSGVILSQRGQLDGTGQALWALEQHAALAGDASLVRALLPAALAATGWIRLQLRTTSAHGGPAAGLLPYSDPRDNENLRAHLLGSDAWALAGMEGVLRMADPGGGSPATDSLRAAAVEYRARLLEVFDREANRQGRPLPPSIEPGARDWGNWSASYPCEIVEATDTRAIALDRFARRRFYRDGLPSIGAEGVLNCYLGFDLAQAALRRNERATVLADLNSAVLHTQPDGSGLEIVTREQPDYLGDLPPHTTFAAMFTDLVRSALVYERGDSLVLLGGVPVSWLERTRTPIRVAGAPTRLGPVEFTLERVDEGALELHATLPAPALVLLPNSLVLAGVTSRDGGPAASLTSPHGFTLPRGKGVWTIRLLPAVRTGGRSR
jgi:hypothetical protein